MKPEPVRDAESVRPQSCPACAGYGLIAVAGGEDFIFCNDPWHYEQAAHIEGEECING